MTDYATTAARKPGIIGSAFMLILGLVAFVVVALWEAAVPAAIKAWTGFCYAVGATLGVLLVLASLPHLPGK